MKKTSKEFMEWLGLKVGDRVAFKFGVDKVIFKVNENELEYENGKVPLYTLLNIDFEILPQPKRVGDLKCSDLICDECPLNGLPHYGATTNQTLFEKAKRYYKGMAKWFVKALDEELNKEVKDE